MVTGLHRLEKAFLDLLFPPRCVGCGRVGNYLCPDCRAGISRICPPICRVCGQPVRDRGPCLSCFENHSRVDGIRSAAFFEGPLREAIHAFKYDGVTALGGVLGELLAEGWEAFHPPTEVIMPVPLHRNRRRRRGYDQARILAEQLAQRLEVPILADVLVRVRETVPQVDLGAKDRLENVKDAFACEAKGEIEGRAVLLIDDVCTTGATLNACADALRVHRPRSVWALTLARPR